MGRGFLSLKINVVTDLDFEAFKYNTQSEFTENENYHKMRSKFLTRMSQENIKVEIAPPIYYQYAQVALGRKLALKMTTCDVHRRLLMQSSNVRVDELK